MMNNLAKALVLAHVVMSISGMTWAMIVVLQGRDFGWIEPAREVVERNADGTDKKAVRHASEFDKSIASLREASRLRDGTLVHVQPALDSIRATEPYLPNNHLFYLAQLKQLREAEGKIEVKRLQNMGMTLEPGTGKLGPPVLDKVVDGVEKSYKTYTGDLQKLFVEIDAVEDEIRKIVSATREITKDLTGTVPDETDPLNKPAVYVHPGLYQMTELEFKSATQLKVEIDSIKPHWSKAVEQARQFQYRRIDLEATLEKLTAPEPKGLKK